jgi:hypothetical protein
MHIKDIFSKVFLSEITEKSAGAASDRLDLMVRAVNKIQNRLA